MSTPAVTALIPHFKTLELAKVCLRLIRRHTPREGLRVVVIDNGSNDESIEYLRSLEWIELIERVASHEDQRVAWVAKGVAEAMHRVATPFLLLLHTDTLVRRTGWLEYLLGKIRAREDIAGVGSWKLERKSFWRRSAKNLGGCGRQLARMLLQAPTPAGSQRYLRGHCVLYRTVLLKEYGLPDLGGDLTARAIHRTLVRHGHEMIFLNPRELDKYVIHLNHATTVLNAFSGKRTIRRGMQRIRKGLDLVGAAQVLDDHSLDF